jgi:hypothetical protein
MRTIYTSSSSPSVPPDPDLTRVTQYLHMHPQYARLRPGPRLGAALAGDARHTLYLYLYIYT